jgi:hypothetical protein
MADDAGGAAGAAASAARALFRAATWSAAFVD